VAYSRGNSQFPTLIDVFVAIAILMATLGFFWAPAADLIMQGIKTVTAPNATQFTAPIVTIEIVFDTPPTQTVTINNYHAMYRFHDDEGYHMVFVVPASKTYVLSPVCCTRSRYLSPGKHYAFWLGECVAIRTDK